MTDYTKLVEVLRNGCCGDVAGRDCLVAQCDYNRKGALLYA